MAGTREGGLKAAAKNTANDPDYYTKIGRIGGQKGRTGGFASAKLGSDGMTGPDRASVYGTIGGRISRRTKKAKV